jgi:hypothetical protein
MTTSLLTLRIQRKRDIVLARQRARHMARFLGLDAREQATLACAVFEMAYRTTRQMGPVLLEFRLTEATLQVTFTRAPKGTRNGRRSAFPDNMPLLETSLPEHLPMPPEDLAWASRQLAKAGPVDCFVEMRQQSQELLQTLIELRRVEARVAPSAETPAAA